MKNKINFKYSVAAGVILVISGTLVLLTDYIKDKRDVVWEADTLIGISVEVHLIFVALPSEIPKSIVGIPQLFLLKRIQR